MPAYWLTFRLKEEAPDRGWPLSDLRALITRVNTHPDAPKAIEWWRMHSHQQAQVGDRIYVFKQGTRTPRGIIGVGEIFGGPEERATPTDPDLRWRVGVWFQKLVDPTSGFILPLAAVEDVLPTFLLNAAASGFSVPDGVAGELERRLAPILLPGAPAFDSERADDPTFDPASVADERERATRAICVRRGQSAFRAALMAAYDWRCAVTGCDVADVLEAAHISPYNGPSSNRASNGLLLHADIHTLFDCGLLAIDPNTRQVVIAAKLKGSNYAALAGQILREPKTGSDRPDLICLQQRMASFEAGGKK